MEIIKSVANDRVKLLRKMKDDKSFMFLDNPKLIEEAIISGYEIAYLIVEESKLEKYEKLIDLTKTQPLVVASTVFKTLSNNVFSQGILGVSKALQKAELSAPKSNFLILDEVQDPGNVGTLIRSAVGAGFTDVYLLNCASLSNEKVIRSTMGSLFRTKLYETTREKFCEFIKEQKLNILVADMNGENLFGKKFEQPCGVVVGNEGNGVSDEIRKFATSTISIPMQNGLESLNAGVAGSIVMFYVSNI